MKNQNSKVTPPRQLSVVEKLKLAYILWQEYLKHFPKTSKYTLGEKIDTLFLHTLEYITTASILPVEEKLPYLKRASVKLDILKFFLQMAWETKHMQTKHYTILSEQLDEVGRMLGGWKRGIESKTLPK